GEHRLRGGTYLPVTTLEPHRPVGFATHRVEVVRREAVLFEGATNDSEVDVGKVDFAQVLDHAQGTSEVDHVAVHTPVVLPRLLLHDFDGRGSFRFTEGGGAALIVDDVDRTHG